MKRLILCADGTWNIRDQADKESGKRRPTNVTKIARAVKPRDAKGVDQIVFYIDGVGTNGGADKFTGGAFGRGIEENVRELYRFLVYNYEPGDEVFLFGFSRGAFTVRTLAGFLNAVGLAGKSDDYYVPELYRIYEKTLTASDPRYVSVKKKLNNIRPAPPLKMVGVWDTVGSLGAPGILGRFLHPGKYKYHDVSLVPQIQNAYHAMAIGERRKPFAVNLWARPDGWAGNLKQVWFAGVHCGVGGGYRPDGLANESLHWMVEQAESHGLEVDAAYLANFPPCFNSIHHDSMSLKYRVMGENVRSIGAARPHGEALHQSVLDRMNHAPSNYKPVNVPDPKGAQPMPVCNTTRVARGVPCKEWR